MAVTETEIDIDHLVLHDLVWSYARNHPVRKVAVVGNAPLQPSDKRADDIDSADLVIRVNSFVLDRPEQPRCQGSRVDVVVWNRIVRATEFVYHRYRDRLYLMVEPMRLHGRPESWPSSWPADLGAVSVPNRSIAIPLAEQLGLPWQSEALAPTTGTTAAYLALVLFGGADVVLTGFSFVDDPDQRSWRHQWGDVAPVGPEHRIREEAELMRSWIADGRVRFLR
ncbi:MAG: hypothetical protein ACXVXC_10720 [Nocardioidaceae bacterium]